jgi:hypothetical protein
MHDGTEDVLIVHAYDFKVSRFGFVFNSVAKISWRRRGKQTLQRSDFFTIQDCGEGSTGIACASMGLVRDGEIECGNRGIALRFLD